MRVTARLERSAVQVERTVVTFNWTRAIREFVNTPAEGLPVSDLRVQQDVVWGFKFQL